MNLFKFTCLTILFLTESVKSQTLNLYEVPGKNEYCKIDTLGERSVLPSGRFVTPHGEKIRIGRAPFGLTTNIQETYSVILHSNAISVINLNTMEVDRYPSYDGKNQDIMKGSTFIGAKFSEDGDRVFLSGGDNGIVRVFSIRQRKLVDSFDCNSFYPSKLKGDCFITDLLIDESQSDLWVLDRAWQKIYRIDLITKKLKYSASTGRIPFGMALTEDKKSVVFVNVGIYNYPKVPGITPTNKDSNYLHFPPYGAYTSESEFGVTVHGKEIPGLGSPNTDESMSVYVLDVLTGKIRHKIRLGQKVGEFIEGTEIVGGSHPNSIVCHGDLAYISATQTDEVFEVNVKSGKILRRIPILTQSYLDKFKGYFPYGLDLDKKKNRLYVALLGYNALASIDVKTGKTLGFIPSGWGASRVLILPKSNQIVATSIRGYGAGPNGGKHFKTPPQGGYIGDIQLGLFQKFTIPSDEKLNELSQKCLSNTMTLNSVNLPKVYHPNLKAVSDSIKYIVYITKENRTYDEVLGQLKNGLGDSSLSRFGLNAENFLKLQLKSITSEQLKKYNLDSFVLARQMLELDHLNVASNHIKIANQFAFSDNFYCDSDASIHGHHWMMGTIPNEYVETNSAHAGSFKIFSEAPGRRFPRTTGAQDPEDYNLEGGLWEALERNKISVYNFGEANEYTDVQEEWYDTLNGTALPVAFPMPKSIYNYTSRNYAGYNTSIPDQFRVEQFETEFQKLWLNKKSDLPGIITIQLPNDHTSGPRPTDGYWCTQSYMADNDLALGRMLQFLSNTRYWKNMLVIITEDDPQGGVDHIDAHRSLLLMAGPYVKRNYVSHTHANFGSILRTIYQLKGISPVNQYDATASVLSDFFTDKPNYAPFTFIPSDLRIFNPDLAMKKYNRQIPWREVKLTEPMDDETSIKKNNK